MSDSNWRKRPKFWTPQRLWRLMELLELGWSDERIGADLGRSANAVNLARKRHGLRPRRGALLSSREVARMMGVSCSKTVARWIELGLLCGRRGQQWGPYRQWYVTRAALVRFVEDPATWPAWQPERITDAGLRYHAERLRVGVHYLTTAQVAWRLCAQTHTVSDWIRRGWLPATRYGNWWIREDDLARFELPRIGGYRRAVAA